MFDDPEIHPVQWQIIQSLRIERTETFSALNKDKLANDWFSFHIRRLKKLHIIEKNENGLYMLTEKGKTISLALNQQVTGVRKQPKVSALVICFIQKKFLIQQRLVEPFYGYYEFMTERTIWGLPTTECITETFRMETGLEAVMVCKGLDHKIDYSVNKTVMDDKYFIIFEATEVKGKLQNEFPEGKNFLMTKEEILVLEKTHFDLANIFTIYETNTVLREIEGFVKNY